MDTIHFYVDQTDLFLKTISFWHLVFPLNNLASMSVCLWVQGKSNTPPSRGICVLGNSYYMVLPQYLVSLIFMNMQMR